MLRSRLFSGLRSISSPCSQVLSRSQRVLLSTSSYNRLQPTSTSLSTASPSPVQTSTRLFTNSTSAMAPTKGMAEPDAAATLVQPEGSEDWKHREPYRIHESSDNFEALYEAHCHCGRVQYQLSREKPLASKFCHCTTCQRLHGAAFQWAAIFHKGDINFTNGHHDLVWYDPSEKTTRHKLPCKVSCGHCRTPIMDEGRNMILLFPTLVKFKNKEERDKWAPTCHMFYPQRVVDLKDGTPKYEKLDKEGGELDKSLW